MSRKPAPLRPRKCIRNKKPSWEVRVPQELVKAEGYKRRFFDKESLAAAYCVRLKGDLVRYSDKARGLSDGQKIEATECFTRLAGFPGATLTAAVDLYIGQLDQSARSFLVSELAERVIADKLTQQGRGSSESLIAEIRERLGRFSRTYGESMVADITAEEARAWILGLKAMVQVKEGDEKARWVESDRLVSQKTRRLYRITMSLCFSWAKERKATAINPFKEFKLAVPDKKRVFIYTPAQTADLLRAARPEMKPYLALCAFAGLRPEHCQGFGWELIHFDRGNGGELEVPASTDKTEGERIVPMQANLRAWLLATPADQRRGEIFHSRRFRREAYEKMRRGHSTLPATWPQDGLRHGFASYRVKVIGSFGQVAQEMGNSEAVVREKYYRSMSDTDAAAYWQIYPPEEGDKP